MVNQLTPEQQRLIRDYIPTLSNRPPGFDIAAWLHSLFATVENLARSAKMATIASGTASVVIAFGADFDGKPVVATLNTEDNKYVTSAVWDGAGNLTVTLHSNATSDLTVSAIAFAS
jgi:hypothetical protein